MGKFGKGAVAAAAMSFFALVPSREAAAQDFGQSWIDRITHELEQERGPLTPKPLDLRATAGVNYVYDNNIFLADSGPGKKKDSIVIPFVQLDLNYAEPRFDIEASFLGDYKRYFKESASDDEERFFVRARQTSARWNFEISEIFQHVSDPAGLVFLNRVARIVSTTVPKIAFDIGRSWAIEVGGNIQIVRYEDPGFSAAQENNNFSIDARAIYRTPWAFDLQAQFGYYNINYLAGGTPDAFGYYYRGGFRGNITERLTLEALVGYQSIETDFFAGGGDINDGTAGGMANLRYEITENLNLFFDVARQYTFWGAGDPFQLLDTASVYLRYQATEVFWGAIRAAYEHAHTALGVSRKYYAGSINLNYRFLRNLVADLGATYRGGDTDNAGGKVKFSDIIISGGVAITW